MAAAVDAERTVVVGLAGRAATIATIETSGGQSASAELRRLPIAGSSESYFAATVAERKAVVTVRDALGDQIARVDLANTPPTGPVDTPTDRR